MSEVTDVDIEDGIPTGGTGTVPSLAKFDRGSGTGGSYTLRVILDSSQSPGDDYETVAASQTDQILGATGAQGDYLQRLICSVSTAATAAVSIKDANGSSIAILPNSPGGGVGVYVVEIGAACTGSTTPGWKVTTGAGVTVLAVGSFT